MYNGLHLQCALVNCVQPNTAITGAAAAARTTSTRPNGNAGDQLQTRVIAAASRSLNVRQFFSQHLYTLLEFEFTRARTMSPTTSARMVGVWLNPLRLDHILRE